MKCYTKEQVEYGIAEALKVQSYHHITVKKIIEEQLEDAQEPTIIPNSAAEKLKSTEQASPQTYAYPSLDITSYDNL
ncbi:hypothetical protein [Thorsellia anophelis]|uniref:hypothetical protein n=1 Tax=Thorsellia anophelis TaxID=336804 RepID=UPI000B855775|nr:hypothetical protein [Thorsellia anophelis]